MPAMIVLFASLVVAAQMFAVGLNQDPQDLVNFLRNPRLMWRALASVLLLVPLATLLLIAILRPPVEVMVGLSMLAAAPGAPLTTRRSEAAGADTHYVSALQFMLALLAVVFTPLLLGLFEWVFDLPSLSVTAAAVARQIAIVTFVPAALGWLFARYAPQALRAWIGPLLIAAKVLFFVFLGVVVLALILASNLRDMLLIGWTGGFAVLAMAALAIIFGHVLGGPQASTRSGIAIATVARNLGLALYIADLSPSAATAIPTILTYALVGVTMAIPYSVWMKRQAGDAAPTPGL